MQIVECTKRNTGDSADRTRGDNQPFNDKQVEEWDVVVSDAGASSTWILANAPIPNAYSTHPDNPKLRCTGEYQVRRVDGSPIHFQVTVTYETPPPGSPLPEPEELPNDKRPEKREREPYLEEWSTLKTQEPIDVDIQGKAIATVVGEQFDPPLSIDVHDMQVTFGKNVDQRNDALIEAVGKMNADAFLGFDLFQCVIDSVNYKYLTDPDNNKPYWRQTVTVLIRTKVPPNFAPGDEGNVRKVWDLRVRAEGYKVFRIANDDKPVKAKDDRGEDVVSPALHDRATGEQIDDVKKAQWYRFIVRESVQFGPLNIN